MAYNIKFSLMLAAAAGLLLAGCQKQDNLAMNDGDAPLSFAVGIVGDAGFDHSGSDGWSTKADNRISTLTQFKVKGFEGSSDWFPETTVSTSSMAYSDYIWHTGVEHTFYACANLPTSGASASIASTGVTLNYTAVPTSQADQKDILLGSYAGKGNKGEAEIQFYHPLTAIAFKVDAITDVTKIKSITLDGTYKSGSVTLSETSGTPAFAWTASETQNGVSQTMSVTSFTKGTKLGDPFILIPQDLAAKKLTVKIVATVGGADRTVTATLTTGTLPAGKTTTYDVSYEAAKGLNFSTPVVSNWGTGDALAEEMGDLAGPRPNEIWYTTSNEQVISKSTTLSYKVADHSLLEDFSAYTYKELFGSDLVSNTYKNGMGIMKFAGPITKIGDYAFLRSYSHFMRGRLTEEGNSNLNNLISIILPEGLVELGQEVFAGFENTQTIYLPNSLSTVVYSDDEEVQDLSSFGLCRALVIINGVTYSEIHGKNSRQFRYITISENEYDFWVACFLNGTLITLADGSKKKVEDITYEDELLVWNFDKGCYDTAKILWLTKKGLKSEFYYKCTFSDGTVLNIVGNRQTGHRLFNATDLSFDHCNEIEAGKDIFTEHGNVKLVSCEVIDSVEVEYVNLITDQHINCFANEVLTSARYNNRWPIDQDMKFVKDGRKIRPYREFRKAGISRQWYDGMRLGEQQDSIARVRTYIDRCELNGDLNPDWKEPGFFARIWNWIKGLFS